LEPLNLKKKIYKKLVQQIIEILNQLQYYQPSPNFISELCSLLLNREGIIYNGRNPFVNLSVDAYIEVMRYSSAEEYRPENYRYMFRQEG
jgi:hypothetical protein